VCLSVCLEGGLEAAQRLVNDGGKCLWLITPWKKPGVAGAAAGRGFWPALVPWDRTDAGSMRRKISELSSHLVPAGERDTCQAKCFAKRRWRRAPCSCHAPVMSWRKARLHQSSKTSACSGSCWAAHAGSAHAQSRALQRPREGPWRCKPREGACACTYVRWAAPHAVSV